MAEPAACIEEEMLNMEERLYGTLKRTVELLSVPQEKIDEGNRQLNEMMEATRERFTALKAEIDEQTKAIGTSATTGASPTSTVDNSSDVPTPQPITLVDEDLVD